jgi:hypothetical protein
MQVSDDHGRDRRVLRGGPFNDKLVHLHSDGTTLSLRVGRWVGRYIGGIWVDEPPVTKPLPLEPAPA